MELLTSQSNLTSKLQVNERSFLKKQGTRGMTKFIPAPRSRPHNSRLVHFQILPFSSYFERMKSHHINKCGQRYQHIALISGYPTNTLEIKIIENNCFTQSVYFYIRRKLNWPGELAQWLKCLPYMSEDLSSIPSIHTKSSTWPIL